MSIPQNLSIPINFNQFLTLKETALDAKWFAVLHGDCLMLINYKRQQTIRVIPSLPDGLFLSIVWSDEDLTNFDNLIEFTKKEEN